MEDWSNIPKLLVPQRGEQEPPFDNFIQDKLQEIGLDYHTTFRTNLNSFGMFGYVNKLPNLQHAGPQKKKKKKSNDD